MIQHKIYELKTWDKRSWALTEPEYAAMNERLEAGVRFLTIPDGSSSKVAIADIKFFGKRQISMGEIISEKKSLPQGEIKSDPLAPGYIKFVAMSIKMKLRHGVSVANVVSPLTDEQKSRVNEFLASQRVDFQI